MLSAPIGDIATLAVVIALTGSLSGLARSILFLDGYLKLPQLHRKERRVYTGFLGDILIGIAAAGVTVLVADPGSLLSALGSGMIGGLGGNAVVEAYAGKERTEDVKGIFKRTLR